jgi:regulator of replication initiation timing
MAKEDAVRNLERTVGGLKDDLAALAKKVKALKRENAELRITLRTLAEGMKAAPAFLVSQSDARGSVGIARAKFMGAIRRVQAKTPPLRKGRGSVLLQPE